MIRTLCLLLCLLVSDTPKEEAFVPPPRVQVWESSVHVKHFVEDKENPGTGLMHGGSGTVVSRHRDQALVLTCCHVVKEDHGATLICIGNLVFEGVVFARDEWRDLAAVKIRVPKGLDLSCVNIAKAPVEIGDQCYKIGYPGGVGPIGVQGKYVKENKVNEKHPTRAGCPTSDFCLISTHGDSGCGIFNPDGCLVSVLWGGYQTATEHFTAGVPLAEIRAFCKANCLKDFPYTLSSLSNKEIKSLFGVAFVCLL